MGRSTASRWACSADGRQLGWVCRRLRPMPFPALPFDNRYARELSGLYVHWRPQRVAAPRSLYFNDALAGALSGSGLNTVRLELMTSRHRPPSHRLQANGITPSLWLEQRRRGVNGCLSGALAVMTFKRRVSALDHPRPSLLKRAYRFELTAGLQQLIEPTRPQSWLLWGERPRSGAGRGAATAHAS